MSYPELSEFIDLTAKKISLLEQANQRAELSEDSGREISDEKKQSVEVSLSSSGMGFFSESFAEDDATVEISLTYARLI